MADKITLDQVNELLGVLRTDASVDAKVQLVTAAKSGIKQHNVPDHAIPVLFEALRTASSSQHAALVNAGFTGLNHLLTRLSRQEPKFLAKEAARTLPLIVEKLGDVKEKYRTLAQQSLVTLYQAAPMDVERSLRNTAMTGKNPRAKETSMQWLLQMHHEHSMPFRAYVPVLMELLEDADGMVRDAAKATVVELFRDAPNAAKTDLKKQLKNFKVRPAIEQAIVKELAPTGASSAAAADPVSRPESVQAVRPKAPISTASSFAASVSSLSERPITPVPDASRAEAVEPAYVNTQRELDDIFKEMHIWFEGKETEQNWLKREESVTRLRRLLAGNAGDYAESFVNNTRALLDGIIKAVVTLRTSLCKESCSLVQDIANTFGSGIDPMVEILLQTLVKLSAGTKKISSQLANTTVEAIISNATYSTRILQHVWGACQDKNVQPRTYASGWVKTIINKEMHHKSHVEHSGGLDLIEKCIKKGLVDPNPGVRERMRATYWFFAGVWPARAEAIMTGLDGTAQKLLQNDSNNPNSPKKPEGAAEKARPGLGFSKSTTGAPKPSLREAMLAKKKEALATRNLPARPGSAMAHFSPVRTVSGSSTSTSSSTATATTSGTSAAAAEAKFTRQRGEGGLSVAPVRPTRRRPELHTRPATAGPYSVRTHDHPSAEQSSPPDRLRSKAAITPKTLGASPKRTGPGPRTRPGHQATASDSNLVTPSRAVAPPATKAAAGRPGAAASSPRTSPAKPKPGAVRGAAGHKAPPAHASTSPTRVRNKRAPEPVPEAEPEDEPEIIEKALEVEIELPLERSVTPTSPTPTKPAAVRKAAPTTAAPPPVDDDDALNAMVMSPPLKVYEDPFQDDQPTATPTAAIFAPTVLEDRPVNEDAGNLARMPDDSVGAGAAATIPADAFATTVTDATRLEPNASPALFPSSPEKAKQNARLLDSGIAKVKAQALDVHGFRKLQGIIRDASNAAISNGMTTKTGAAALFTDERFDALLLGLFAYLESPVTNVPPEKVQDVKAQILATIKLLLKKSRDNFQPHVSRGLEALLAARAGYDARTHMVAGLELLADELVTLGDAAEIALVLTRALSEPASANGNNGNGNGVPSKTKPLTSPHSLSMGLHVLKVLVDARPAFHPTDTELAQLSGLAQHCLESSESGVRMDAVQLCVAVHERVGDARFWGALRGVKDDPKSLITYYIVKRQREQSV